MTDAVEARVADEPAPLRTPLVDEHRALGARLVPFAGWEMPVQYRGIVEEHRAVRGAAGLFDLSHMGEVWVSGPGAGDGLAFALVTDPPRLAVGRAHYSMICAEDGGILDDLIVYRVAPQRYLIVPNASNRERVVAELRVRLERFEAVVDDASLRTGLIALQGPRAAILLAPLTDVDLASLRYYAIAEGHAAGVPCWIARTGYTGEDGFELFVAWDDAVAAWRTLLAATAAPGRDGDGPGATTDGGVVPCGLGARDTLRLEAGMPLYGNELGPDRPPHAARLGRVVKLDKQVPFVGRDALERVGRDAPREMLVGLVMRGRGIARHGYPVHVPGEGAACGEVTSGAPSPTLGTPIAMAYVPPRLSEPGTMLEVGIRAARVAAEVVPLPFYTRST